MKPSSYIATFLGTMLQAPALLAIPGLEQRIGRRHLYEQSTPPRIVWALPQRESFQPMLGYAGAGRDNPETMHFRLPVLEAHLWAADPEIDPDPNQNELNQISAIDDLAELTLRAVRAQKWTGFFYRPRELRHYNEEEAARYLVLELGKGAVLSIELLIPVVGATAPTVKLTDAPITKQFVVGGIPETETT